MAEACNRCGSNLVTRSGEYVRMLRCENCTREIPAPYESFVEHLKAGGAPFAGPWDANIVDVIEGYRKAVSDLHAEIARLEDV